MQKTTPPPKLSIIVIFFNMRREAERTLHTLSCDYQRHVNEHDYEVIAIDNNSSEPLEQDFVECFGPNFSHHYFNTDSVSPCEAVNFGASLARGRYLSCIVDGARMLTPQTLHYTLMACNGVAETFVCSLAWHLGPKNQNESMLEGYNQTAENQLLESVDWKSDGYRLFDISTIAPSSSVGFLGGVPQECSYFAIEKERFVTTGGFDERFQSPGGGLVNHDFLQRIIQSGDLKIVVLLGEASFHQFHGGVATNAKPSEHPFARFAQEYEDIHDRAFTVIENKASEKISYLGSLPAPAQRFLATNMP